MFVGAKARARFRSVLRRGVFARPRAPRRLQLVLTGAIGMCLSFALAAGAQVGAGASGGGVHGHTPASPFPLSVRQISVRTLRGRIVGTATIVNAGNARVRSSTGLLGLNRGSGGNATGVLTFSVPSLPPQGSRSVRFRTRPIRALPVGSGTYTGLVCTDIYSQIQRFAQNPHCSPGPRLAISTRSRPEASGRVPNTIVRTGPVGVSRSSTAVVRFGSTVNRSAFRCSLDGAPWLACRSPQSYHALVDGAHVFDVRAISPLGREDPTPAHRSWTADTVAPKVTLRSPVSQSPTNHHKPVFSGAAGTAPGDSSRIKVKVFSGSGTSGTPLRTLTATIFGSRWSVGATRQLVDGTYTAQAKQSDSAGNTGVSRRSTFTIDAASASKTYSVGGTVSGLSATVVLQDNGGDDLNVSSNGAFAFATRLATGAAYNVTVKTSPSGQSCSVSGGKGTVASANITKIAVTCTTPGQDDFNRANGGLGAGWAAMSDGGLSIVSQQVVGTANAQAGDVRVAESYGSDQYSQVEVTSTQLSGGEWVGPTVRSRNGGQDTYLGIYFWNDGTPQLRLYKRTAGTWIQLGDSYNSGALPVGTKLRVSAVGSTISFQQNSTTRIAVSDSTLTGGAPGIMTYGAATADNWAGGAPSTYSIGGTVSGLSGTVVLQDNGGDDLSLSSNGAFTFATRLATGVAYNVTVKTNPTGQTCTVSGGKGTVASANITKVAVTCTTNTYSIGGTVSGLSGTVVLQDNGGDDLSLSSNGAFTFATPSPTGVAYNVTVETNPSGQSCSVSGGAGTVGTANVTGVAVSCTALTPGQDDFNRADGGLGAGWVAMSDGGLSIVSQHVVGTAGAQAGDIRVGESYGSDQYSQVEVTSTQLSGGQWVGPTVRSQNGGQDTYLGIYFWNNGTPQLRLYERTAGTWTQVGDSYNSGPLPAGTKLRLSAVGSIISFQQNGTTRIAVSDSTLTGGAPGIMTYGAATADNWAGGAPSTYPIGGTVSGLSGTVVLQDNGGDDLSVSSNGAFTFATPLPTGAAYNVTVKTNPSGQSCSVSGGTGTVGLANVTGVTVSCTASTGPSLQIQYSGTDANGVAYYNYTSPDDGYGTHVLRVLAPTNPVPGVPHNFLYLLPVEPELGSAYGDGIDTLRTLNAQNQYNLTIIEPSFANDPWYADNPYDPNLQYETFMTQDLVPWVTQNLVPPAASQPFSPLPGHEQNWLIGFSKSGIGGDDLLLKHPDVFAVAGSWDFPADMSTYDQFGSSSAANYGTDANFQANYRLTRSFVDSHKTPFLGTNRIWIGGYEAFQPDMADYDALLTSEGIAHTTETPTLMAHRWDSGWVPIALSAMSQDGGALAATP